VPSSEISGFPSEYQHEPIAAFDGGADGLDLVHKILNEASSFLSPEGHLVVEVGESCTTLENAYPQVAFNWLETGVENSGLFILSRQELDEQFNS
jgi:ribosomal protein L3 glutamine methyltransferase